VITDEYTSISIEPKYTFPGDEVTLTIETYSNDYHANHNIEYEIYIDDKEWKSPYCNISFVEIDVSKCMENMHEREKYGIKEIESEEGRIKIVADCVIPTDVAPGPHILRVIPKAYSEIFALPEGKTGFVTYRMVSIIEILMRFFSFLLA